MAGDRATVAVRVHLRRKVEGAVDSVSALPDVILQHILSFVPTKLAVETSVLSKRWRHVWCDLPSLSLIDFKLKAASIDETLTRYTAPKMMNFHLEICEQDHLPHIDRWIEFAMSRNVENLSLRFWIDKFTIPDFIYISSSLKQLRLQYCDMIPRCNVTWTSLKDLSLCGCRLTYESLAKILSGCPLLESLTLHFCVEEANVLDLSKVVHLRTLEIERNCWLRGPTQIVAPQIRCLVLKNSQLPRSLVDVSFLQVTVLEMLEMLQNVEKLTFGGKFLQILSLAEIRGLAFPMLKVKALTLETPISRYVIPGIERILQSSPGLKKLTVHTRHYNAIIDEYLNSYLASKGLDPDQCWRSKDGVQWNKDSLDAGPNHVASFFKLLLKNTKILKKMVVQLERSYCMFKKVVLSLSHQNNNVSIVVSTLDKW